MNTLAQRLKFAKRELTNLKTVHQRGLDSLKVYREVYAIPKAGISEFYWLTITFTVGTSNYPFMQLDTFSSSPDDDMIGFMLEFEYKNNGYTGEFRFPYWANSDVRVVARSTSPILSMSYSWSAT